MSPGTAVRPELRNRDGDNNHFKTSQRHCTISTVLFPERVNVA